MKRLTLIFLSLLLCLSAGAELSNKKFAKDVKAINAILAKDPNLTKQIKKPVQDIYWHGSKEQKKWLAKRLLELDVNRLSNSSKYDYDAWVTFLIYYQCIDSPFFIELAGGRTRAEREQAMLNHLVFHFYDNRYVDNRLLQALSVLKEIQTFIEWSQEGDSGDAYLGSIQQEFIALRTYFLEHTFYGTTTYAESHYPQLKLDAQAQRIAATLNYSDFLSDPRRLQPHIINLGEEYNSILWGILPELFVYDYTHLSFEDMNSITGRIRDYANTQGRAHEMEEIVFAVFQDLLPTIYQANAARFSAVQANNDDSGIGYQFAEFKQHMEEQGKEFINYKPLDCPYELRQDSLYEKYVELYLRCGFVVLKEMTLLGGVKDYIHNPSNIATLKTVLDNFGYDTNAQTWDNQLVYYTVDMAILARDTYYRTQQSWLIGACIEFTGVMTQLYDEWYNPLIIYAIGEVLAVFENAGYQAYAEQLIENYGVPALQRYISQTVRDKEVECFAAESCASLLPHLTIFKDKRYAELAEQVANKLDKHIRKGECDMFALYACMADYLYRIESEDALPYYQAYLDMSQDTVYVYLNFVGLYGGSLKQYDKAVPYADWLIENHPTLMIEAYSYDALAVPQIYAKAGQMKRTIEQLRLVEDHLKNDLSVKLLVVSDEQCSQIIENYEHIDSRFAQLLSDTIAEVLKTEFAKSFYDWQLLSKGLLLALNKEKENLLLNHPSPFIRQQYMQLLDIQKKLAEKAMLNKTEQEMLKVNRDLAQHNLQQAVQSYIDEHGFEGLNLTGWQDVQQALKPDEVAIEFVSGYLHDDTVKTYFALLLRHDSEQPIPVQLFYEDSIQQYIRNKRETQIYNDPDVNRTIARMVMTPLQEYIRPGETVYFAATGALHQIALENMYLDNEHLVSDIYQMRRLSSTRQLVRAEEEQGITRADSIVLYGGIRYDAEEEEMLEQSDRYPDQKTAYRDLNETDIDRGSVSFLKGTLEEVNRIDTMLCETQQAHTLLKDLQANEESFKALSGTNTTLLHVATHGFFWKKESAMLQTYTSGGVSEEQVLRQIDPLRRCGLLMAGANTALSGHASDLPQGVQDGVLTGQEISLLDLNNTRIAILSACKTGVGEVTGDGVFGLQRAFKKAGVETLIMSLWKVNDAATQLLMTEFYRNWITLHQPKREAFRNAQHTVRARYEEPTYWAGFIMLD